MAHFIHRRSRLLGALVMCLAQSLWASPATATSRAAAAVPQAEAHPREVAPYTTFYGVYVGGSKVGWMRSTYAVTDVPTLSYHLEAQVRGMGRTTPVTVQEERRYDAKTRRLMALSFSQKSDAGEMSVRGARLSAGFECITTAGGADHKTMVQVQETLDHALAVYPLVSRVGAHAGDEITVPHFDAQAQAETSVHLHIDKVDDALVAGVATKMFTLTTTYKDMGVKEQSTFDGTGKLIATHMGGFFEARLEPEDVAKKTDLVQDVLMQAVVKTPSPIARAEALDSLTLTMSGFDDAPPPVSARQQVQRTADGWRLTLRKDAPLPPLPYPERRAKKPDSRPKEVAAALEPTAFIQSAAPEIKAAARAAVAGCTTVPEAIGHLVAYVRSHLRAEYVPAFSNALEALQTGRGDCTEFSVLFVALARAAGLPARVAVGVAYWPLGEGFGWHAWAEVFADGRWISVDPTWGQTVSDVTHLKFAEGGPIEQARVVMLLGRLKVLGLSTP